MSRPWCWQVNIDPVTPPAWGELVAQDLANSYFYEYPGAGHGPSLAIDCARQMMIAFIQNPTGAPTMPARRRWRQSSSSPRRPPM